MRRSAKAVRRALTREDQREVKNPCSPAALVRCSSRMRTLALLLLASGPLAACRSTATPAREARVARGLEACRRSKELSDRQEFEAALREIRRALELDPANAWAHYHLGWMLSETEGCERALPDYSRAIELCERDAPLDPLRWKAHLNRGYCELQLGRHEQARADLTQVIEHAARRDWVLEALDWRAQSEFALGLESEGRRDQERAERLREIPDETARP